MNTLINNEEGYVKPSIEIIDIEIESAVLAESDSSEVGGEDYWD